MLIFLYYFRNFNKKLISYFQDCVMTFDYIKIMQNLKILKIIKMIQFRKTKIMSTFYWNARLQLLKINRAQKS